ncbi:MAG: amidohydrolase [Actinomycetes bacterium]
MTASPQKPDPTYLERLAARTARLVAEAEPVTSPYGGVSDDVADAVTAAVASSRDALCALSHDVHAHPEEGFAEHHAVAAIAAYLREAGHDVETGVLGVETALRAQAGAGRPRVAVLAEYDALPGVGHACGHNVIAATAVGAFCAVAEQVQALGGSVVLLGTPAEEGGGGKEVLARAGAFDDVDAALMLHPFDYDVADHPFLGRRVVEVTYRGVAAHASAMPFMGRNALDGVVAAYTGIAALRQHIPPTDRVHGIITDGGARANVVPERAAALFYLRSSEPETLTDLCARAQDVFTGAAAATGTAVDVTWDPQPAYLPIRHNGPLAARYAVRASARGRQVLPAGIVPEAFTGSTDLGNVSVRIPAIHPMLALAPPGTSLHTVEFAAAASTEAADDAVADGAAGLALTVADFLADAELRTAVADAFAEDGGALDVARLLDERPG